jgi:hypothetical protein
MPKKSTDARQRCRTCKGPSSRGHQEPNRWSGRRDLNPRLRPWQGRTLPLSYSRSAAIIINEASERGKINAITTGKARGTHRPPPVRLLFCEPRRPGPLGRVQKHFRSTRGETPSESPWHISVVARPLRVPFGRDDLAVAHVNDLVAILRCFRIVRDHQDGLAEFLV